MQRWIHVKSTRTKNAPKEGAETNASRVLDVWISYLRSSKFLK